VGTLGDFGVITKIAGKYKFVISTEACLPQAGAREKSYATDSTACTVRLHGVKDLSYVEMTKRLEG